MTEFKDEKYYTRLMDVINKNTKVIDEVSENREDPTRVALNALREMCILLAAEIKDLNTKCIELEKEEDQYVRDVKKELSSSISFLRDKIEKAK